jgi:hypothetical protein
MLGNHKLIVDTQCEVYELLKGIADGEFWDLAHHDIVPGACYMIGRMQFRQNIGLIRNLAETGQVTVVLSNPAEGSDTIRWQCKNLGIEDLVKSGQILVLAGGDADSGYQLLRYDSFMVKILDYLTNCESMKRTAEIYNKSDKPYKFLFLNGRSRPHRRFLLEKFRQQGLLDQALWTNLDTTPAPSRSISLFDQNDTNLLAQSFPVHYLPVDYEVKEYQHKITIPASQDNNFIKDHLFNNTWGEIYLKAEPYIDTYFSVVTETVFDYPYSFRTEKIWKPVAMGHPWIAATSCGYYRDLHNLGFKTFGHLIDESFDLVENSQDRMCCVNQVVQDLCTQDLTQFLSAAQEVCKYNQQHLIETREQEIKSFPTRLEQFLRRHDRFSGAGAGCM